MLGFFNHAPGSLDPGSAGGDGRRLPDEAGLHAAVGRLAVRPAAACRDWCASIRRPPTDNGRPIRGLVRSDFVVTEKEADHSLADRNHVAYAVVDPDSPDNVLTVRDSVNGPRRIVPRDQWRFGRVEGGKSVADTTRVYMAAKFEPGKIYEVVYTAADSAGRRPRPGGDPRRHLDAEVPQSGDGLSALSIPAGAIKRAIGVRRLAERALPAHLPLLRVQSRRAEPQGVRRRDRARGRRRPRQLQPSLRAAVARRPSRTSTSSIRPTSFRSPTSRRRIPETGATDGLLTHAGIAASCCRRSSTRTRSTSTGAAPRR